MAATGNTGIGQTRLILYILMLIVGIIDFGVCIYILISLFAPFGLFYFHVAYVLIIILYCSIFLIGYNSGCQWMGMLMLEAIFMGIFGLIWLVTSCASFALLDSVKEEAFVIALATLGLIQFCFCLAYFSTLLSAINNRSKYWIGSAARSHVNERQDLAASPEPAMQAASLPTRTAYSPPNIVVVNPTAMAAINAGRQPTHSYPPVHGEKAQTHAQEYRAQAQAQAGYSGHVYNGNVAAYNGQGGGYSYGYAPGQDGKPY